MTKPTPDLSTTFLSRSGKERDRSGAWAFLWILLFFAGCRGDQTVDPPTLPADVINLSKNETLSFSPAAAVSGDVVYIVWSDQGDGGNLDIFLSRSTDGGANFDSPLNLSRSTSFSGSPQVALSGNTFYVVWEEFVPARNESDIFFRKADDQGGALTWLPPLDEPGKNLSTTSTPCEEETNPTADAPCPSQFPAIAADGNQVFVAWAEENRYNILVKGASTEFQILNSEIQITTSANRGDLFTSPFSISGPKEAGTRCGVDKTQTPSLGPTLAAENGHLYAAWEDCALDPTRAESRPKILFRRFPDSLNVAPPSQLPIVLSDPIKSGSRPGLAAEGEQVFAVWEEFFLDETPDPDCPKTEVLFTTSLQQGIDFAGPTRPAIADLSETRCGFDANSPKLAVSGSSVYVAWDENRPDLSGISLKRSANGGSTFETRENLSQTLGSASRPALAALGSLLFAFWEDSTLGNVEVVFALR